MEKNASRCEIVTATFTKLRQNNNMDVKNRGKKASCKIVGQKNLATKTLLLLVLIGDNLFWRQKMRKKQDCYNFVLIVLT